MTQCKGHRGYKTAEITLLCDKVLCLVQIGQELAEIYPFVYFSRWRPPPS